MLRIVACDSRAGAHDAPQVAESDSGALHGNVRPRPHRDADVCCGERRRVVDAVAGHRNHLPGGLALAHDVALLVW
jgi:hypothetical protein